MKPLTNEFELELGDEIAVRSCKPGEAVLDIGPLSLVLRGPGCVKVASGIADDLRAFQDECAGEAILSAGGLTGEGA